LYIIFDPFYFFKCGTIGLNLDDSDTILKSLRVKKPVVRVEGNSCTINSKSRRRKSPRCEI